ncbi:MAG: hypothetical protein GX349_07680 [Firmicutes bacterium]|nr:hypothetical protein [Bacillota bacterium]
MKKHLGWGETIFATDYHFPAPPNGKIIDCQIDDLALYPVLLTKEKALVYGYLNLLICCSLDQREEEKSYQVMKRRVPLSRAIPLTLREEGGIDTARGKIKVIPGPWQCREKPSPKERKNKGGLAGCITSFFQPQPQTFTLHISGPISLRLSPHREPPLKEEVPPQTAHRDPEAHGAEPGQWGAKATGPPIPKRPKRAHVESLPLHFFRGRGELPRSRVKGRGGAPPPSGYFPHSQAKKRVSTLPGAAGGRAEKTKVPLPAPPLPPGPWGRQWEEGKKPGPHSPTHREYFQKGLGRPAHRSQPWPDLAQIYPPPARGKGR